MRPFDIIHLGAEHSVTGSCHLLQAGGCNILIDCGIAQGNAQLVPIMDWPVRPADMDYVFLTHAHIDHIGRLPELVEAGFAGEIICTHPTYDLLEPMLRDAMGFSGKSEHETGRLCDTINELAWGFEYGEIFALKKGISFKLGNAGHILGSCFIRFESKDPEWSVIFSGDLGPRDTPILPPPDQPDKCDCLVLESTYGDRLHEDRKERVARLGGILAKALADGGKVFIPSFALGRTQELIYEMDRIFSDDESGKAFSGLYDKGGIPVFIDSPLGLEITEIYSGNVDFWDKAARDIFAKGDHPIDFDHLYSARGHRDHIKLLDMPGPAVIIAGSGMCSGGRIVNHLRQGLNDRKNDIFFVGYQAEGTLGRSILKYGKRRGGYVYIEGEKIFITADIHTLTGYSAHADQKGLLEWVSSMPARPARIKLVHGERRAQEALAAILKRAAYSVV